MTERGGDVAEAAPPGPPHGERDEEDHEAAAERDRGCRVRVVDRPRELAVDARLQCGERAACEGERDRQPERQPRRLGVRMPVLGRVLGIGAWCRVRRGGRRCRGIRVGMIGQEPAAGLEPATTALQERCATNCAKPARRKPPGHPTDSTKARHGAGPSSRSDAATAPASGSAWRRRRLGVVERRAGRLQHERLELGRVLEVSAVLLAVHEHGRRAGDRRQVGVRHGLGECARRGVLHPRLELGVVDALLHRREAVHPCVTGEALRARRR